MKVENSRSCQPEQPSGGNRHIVVHCTFRHRGCGLKIKSASSHLDVDQDVWDVGCFSLSVLVLWSDFCVRMVVVLFHMVPDYVMRAHWETDHNHKQMPSLGGWCMFHCGIMANSE